MEELAKKFELGGLEEIVKIYLKLNEGRLGTYWLWCALERIAGGEDEVVVLEDYGYKKEEEWLDFRPGEKDA